MKSPKAKYVVPVALLLHGLVNMAWAQEPSKQPPLELPKTMAQLDAPKATNAPEEKDKPKSAPVKKAKPVVTEPLADMATDPAKEQMVLPEMGTYKVKAGDTVDRVIQKFYASSPLRSDVLRNALVQSNPKAFVKANPKSLIAGAVLVLPDQAELVKKLMPQLAPVAPEPGSVSTSVANATPAVAAPSLPAPVGGAAAHHAGHNPGTESNKRHWVRYP